MPWSPTRGGRCTGSFLFLLFLTKTSQKPRPHLAKCCALPQKCWVTLKSHCSQQGWIWRIGGHSWTPLWLCHTWVVGMGPGWSPCFCGAATVAHLLLSPDSKFSGEEEGGDDEQQYRSPLQLQSDMKARAPVQPAPYTHHLVSSKLMAYMELAWHTRSPWWPTRQWA